MSGYYESIVMKRETIFAVHVISVALIFIGMTGLVITGITFGQKVTPFPEPRANYELVRRGIYSVIRHPMYLFISILAVGYCLFWNAYSTLFLCAFLVLFFDYKVKREEMYLRQRFPEYLEFGKKTKRFIPYIY